MADIEIEDFAPDRRAYSLIERLVDVWQRSVRATHGFLSDDDIAAMVPEVLAGLRTVPLLAVAFREGEAVGFAGAQAGKLEMLFVDAPARGGGAGVALLGHAVARWDVHRLDVNEQNPQAIGFYEHEGFRVAARSTHDAAGRAFPLLHMERATGVRARMAAGEWFDSADPALAADRARAHALARRLGGDATLDEAGREAVLRELVGSLGVGSTVCDGARFDYGYRTHIGDGCFFNFNCVFLDGAPIVFEDGVWVGPGCVFATPTHPLRADLRTPPGDGGPFLSERALPIRVGAGAWLASNVTVNPGVTIGAGSVIGSGSVVTRDVPAGVLAYGNPCRVVRAVTDADDAGLAAFVGR